MAAATTISAAAATPGRASGPPTAICVRGETIVMQDSNGYPYTILASPYNRLRFMDYAGRRIMYAFDDDNVVEETYTPGIFNCRTGGGRLIQISDTAAVTSAIVNRDKAAYIDLCLRWLSATHQKEYIQTYIRGNRRLAFDERAGKYTVDDGMFRVDTNGNAESAQHSPCGELTNWRSLCIVNTEARERMEVVDPQLGRIIITEKTQMIVGKLLFLLHPSEDDVFLGQLDSVAHAHARRLIAAGPPTSTYDAMRRDDIRGGAPAVGGAPDDSDGAGDHGATSSPSPSPSPSPTPGAGAEPA